MSISSNVIILERAEVATDDSPLALFKTSCGQIDCIFASTITGKKRKELGIGYISTIHNKMKQGEILELLIGVRNEVA